MLARIRVRSYSLGSIEYIYIHTYIHAYIYIHNYIATMIAIHYNYAYKYVASYSYYKVATSFLNHYYNSHLIKIIFVAFMVVYIAT